MSVALRCILALSSLIATLAPVAVHAEEFRHLTGAALRTQITNGKISDDAHWSETYERGGRLVVNNIGHPETGTWRIKDELLCVLRPQIVNACYEVWVAGPKIQLRASGAKDGFAAFLHPAPTK